MWHSCPGAGVVFAMSVAAFGQDFIGRVAKSISIGHITAIQMDYPDQTNQSVPQDAKQACFKVVLPDYLPEGHTFEKAVFFKESQEVISDKYINLYYTNKDTGDSIFMQQRFSCPETAYVPVLVKKSRRSLSTVSPGPPGSRQFGNCLKGIEGTGKHSNKIRNSLYDLPFNRLSVTGSFLFFLASCPGLSQQFLYFRQPITMRT